MPSDIEDFAAAKEEERAAQEEATKQDLRSEVRRLSKTLGREREQRIRLEETIMMAARAAFASWEKPAIPKPTRDPRTRIEETCVAMCSDWHYGAVTADYNREVCERRVGRYADKILSLTEIQRADHPVRAVRLWVLGDLVGGEQIFSGQEHEIDASLVEQSFGVGRLLSDLALRLAGGFDRVHLVCLPGNHGRIGGKAMPYSPDTNADRIAYMVAQERTREPRVTWQIARADTPGETGRIIVDQVGTYGCLLTHGDLFRGGGYGGLPWYQFWKKAMAWRDMSTAGQIAPFDDLACGHWHRTSSIEIGTMTLRVCGTLQTYDPFSREQIAAATRPAQSLLFVHPERGVTAEYRVDLA